MDFIQHTDDWVKGEIFEATIFGSFGLLTIICGLLLWKFGETPNSKAVIIPLAVVGIFFLGTAISGVNSNKKRLPQYTETYSKNRSAFIQTEKKRVEGFQYLYKMTIVVAAACFLLQFASFFLQVITP